MRREFPSKVKVAAFDRAKGKCEQCGGRLYPGKFHYDHRIPDSMLGEPTLDNCDVLCVACHGAKTGTDVNTIAKTKRQAAKHAGIRKRSQWQTKYKRKVSGETVLR